MGKSLKTKQLREHAILSEPYLVYLITDGGDWCEEIGRFEKRLHSLKFAKEKLMEAGEEQAREFPKEIHSDRWQSFSYLAAEVRKGFKHICFFYWLGGEVHREDDSSHLLTYEEIKKTFGGE